MSLLEHRPDVSTVSRGPLGRPKSGWSPARLQFLLPAVDVLVGSCVAVLTHGFTYEIAAMTLVFLVGFRWAGLHRPRLNPSVLEELPRLLAVLVGATGVVLSLKVLIGSPELPARFLHVIGFEAFCIVLARAALYEVVREARRCGLVQHRTLILGCDEVSVHLATVLLKHPEFGLLPVGFLDDEQTPATNDLPIPLIGGLADLGRLTVEHEARALVFVFPKTPLEELMASMRHSGLLSAQVFVVPRLFEVHTHHYLGDSVRGIPLIRLHRSPLVGRRALAKRLLDVLSSAAALLILSPVLLVSALAVRAEGGPGVLFRQERIGRSGQRFQLLKFRSMRPLDAHESETRWNIANDDRIGRVGRIMRKTSLDELPQLWNVLRGDMTLVGPRPERPHFVDRFSVEHPEYAHRHRMPAGLTGWAAVNGLRGDTSIPERVRYDNYYIENWSLWLDISILLRTVGQVLRGGSGR